MLHSQLCTKIGVIVVGRYDDAGRVGQRISCALNRGSSMADVQRWKAPQLNPVS